MANDLELQDTAARAINWEIEAAKLQERLAIAVEALEFYRDPQNYNDALNDHANWVDTDGGKIARNALDQIKSPR